MSQYLTKPTQIKIFQNLLRWFVLLTPISIAIGLLVALFLWLLDLATQTRENNFWIIFFLPVVGLLIHWLYNTFGKSSVKGNNLIIEEIHNPSKGVPVIMGPLILTTTVLTHLVGGSAGREGTAVQIGGSIASFFEKFLKLSKQEKKTLFTTGIAAGFGAVFGTPLAGSIFALEVISMGRIKLNALLPCFYAAIIADFTTRLTGIGHTSYNINFEPDADLTSIHWLLLIFKILFAGIIMGLCSYLFSQLSHILKKEIDNRFTNKLLIPITGSAIIVFLTLLFNTTDYLGLGVTGSNTQSVSIVNAFTNSNQPYYAFLLKIIFTVITLSFGFKGGEVTPLFFIGATLGNTLAVFLNAPLDLFAGIGFVAVFAGATNTPIACTLMGIELFGGDYALYIALGCFTAYYFSGHSGIYTSQKVFDRKSFDEDFENL